MGLIKIQEKIDNILSKGRIQLLSEIEISNGEYTSLLEYTKIKIENFNIKNNSSFDTLLAVTMVYIGINEYTEGNYWDYFDKKVHCDLNAAKHCYLGRIFLNTLDKYNLYIYKIEDSETNRYVLNILMHGFVPNNYAIGFFNFAYSFYDRNLFRQLPDDLVDELDELSLFMLDSLKSDKDNVILAQSKKRPSQTYKLLKSTRAILAENNLNSAKKIFQNILGLIDQYTYDSKLPNDTSRISLEFIKWVESQTDIPRNIKKKRRRKISSILISNKPYLKLNFDTYSIDLAIPEQKFRQAEFNDSIQVEIEINNLSKSAELEIYTAFGAFVTEQFIYKIKGDSFSAIDITIKSGSSKEYKILKQEYRIFDEEGEESTSLQLGKNYFYIKKTTIFNPLNESSIIERRLFADGFLIQVFVDTDTVFYINNIPVTLTGEFSERPIFNDLQTDYKMEGLEGNSLIVTNSHPIIYFKVEKIKKDGTFIWINQRKFRTDIKNTVTEIQLKNDLENTGLRVIIDNLEIEEEKIYEIYIDVPGQQKKLYCTYLLLKNFKIKTDKSRYIFDNYAYINIKGNYRIEPTNSKIVGSGEYEYTITNNENISDFSIDIDKKKYLIHIPIKNLRWKFEGKEWSCLKPHYFWADKLSNSFYIDLPDANKAYLYLNREEKRKIFGEKIKNFFKFDIGKFVNEIRASKYPWNYLNLIYEDTKVRSLLPIFRILNALWIYEFELLHNDIDGVYCNLSYIGDAKLFVKIIDSESKKVLYDKLELKNGKNQLKGLSKNALYGIEKKMVSKDEFGSTVKDLQPIHKIGVINYSDISNCKLVLKEIYFNDKKVLLNCRYTIRDIRKIENNYYIGKMTEKPLHVTSSLSKEITKFEMVKITTLPFERNKSKVLLRIVKRGKEVDFVYDTENENLISSEDNIMFKSKDIFRKEIFRFCFFHEDLAEFFVDYRRVY